MTPEGATMATAAYRDVCLSEHLAHEQRRGECLRALKACGWGRLQPLAAHLVEKRLVRARGHAGAALRHLNLGVLREALSRLLSQDDDDGGYLIYQLVVEGADPVAVAAERGVSRLALVEELRQAVRALAICYEHLANDGTLNEGTWVLQGISQTRSGHSQRRRS
jgi:hypothetical protein